MGFTFTAKDKPKSSSSSSENWGTGFLLVFFPEDGNNNGSTKSTSNNNSVVDSNKTTSNSLLMPSIKRTNSSVLFTKAQSTISICALSVFLTLLLFTLSTFEPSSLPTPSITSIHTPRRFLSSSSSQKPNTRRHSLFNNILKTTPFRGNNKQPASNYNPFALQGLGTLYRRGTKAMPDLVVAHLTEDVKEDEFRLFLRVLHRSGLTAKADAAFLFGASSKKFDSLIKEENDSFLKLVQHYKELNISNNGNNNNNNNNNSTKARRRRAADSVLSFNLTQFVKAVKNNINSNKEVEEPLWGKRIRGNYSNSSTVVGDDDGTSQGAELTRLSYGSMVGFEVSELDPENSLAGFFDHVPMSLRRWACYPMLLGRVRRNFKHVALVDTKHLLLLGDPLGRVRSKSPESVHVSLKSWDKHSKRNSDKTQSHHSVNSAIITGGAKGVRRLSNAMLTEIVRAAMQHKKKSSVTESGVLSQLVGNEHILKNINLITSTESIPDASSLTGSSSKSAAAHGLIQRGGNSNSNSNSNHDVDYSIIMKIICSCEVDSSVYKNC
ncbi:hypothetical protein CISIN_1g008901mg [Citrus sinensis]|uniref:DUF7780 domain-containing protein n=1 Tax=Citrus sinensis TaxID=2711 RepID=A0A067E466_CITSI|nr:hypothetical protein CISIN_1g008901mg [Citrus sinensis]